MGRTPSRLPALLLAGALCAAVFAPVAASSVVGTTPATWNANLGEGMNDSTDVVALQGDGGLLVGGARASFDGAPRNLMRLNPDGTPDAAFNASLNDGLGNEVVALLTQPDRKIVVAGHFADPGLPGRLLRFNADGSPDTAFNAALGEGFDRAIYALAPMSDGDLVVGGSFTTLDGADIPDRLIRLNSDGTIDSDTAFNAGLGIGLSGDVFALATDGDSTLAVGGSFVYAEYSRLIFLNNSGEAFGRAVGMPRLDATVYAIARSADAKYYVGGSFTSSSTGVGTAAGLIRLNADGSPDTAFNEELGTGMDGVGSTPGEVFALAARPDGGVFAGGYFTGLNGGSTTRGLLAVKPDGTADTAFNSALAGGINSGGYIYSIAAISNSDAIISGNFESIGRYPGVQFSHLARVAGPKTLGRVTGLQVTPRNQSATVTWTSPKSEGGYETSIALLLNGPGSCHLVAWTQAGGSARCRGLANGRAYTVSATLFNDSGPGQPTIRGFTPRTTPGRVVSIDYRVVGPGQMRISWSRPSSNGGAALTAFEYCIGTCTRSSQWRSISPASPSVLLTGVKSGRKYTVHVRAVNPAGHGPSAQVSFTQSR